MAASTGTFYGQAMTAGDIYTIAGDGGAGYIGDGVSATSTALHYPSGVAVDSSGNVLISDISNERVRVVAASTGTFYGQAMTAGDIYTIAGNGTGGHSGDGGPATSAELDDPWSVAVDASGNLLIADEANGRIRVVAASTGTFYGQAMTAGDIYTIAGNGTEGYSGDGGPATSAELADPSGVAVDGAGNAVIADSYNDCVRVVAASTGTFYGQAMTAGDIYTIAGNGTGGYSGDGGSATSAGLDYPVGVAVDTSGDVILADRSENRVREISAYGTQTITFTSTVPSNAVNDGPTYEVSANGGASGNPITFSSGTPTVCEVSGSTVSFVGVGICSVLADQAGNADYDSAPEVSQTFSVASAPVTDDYSYAPGGGTGTAPASGSGLDGTTITLAANPFTDPGHTFAGWSDGTTTYAAGASYTLSSDGAPIVFTAQWSTNATDDYSYAPGTGTGTAPASGSGLDGTTITLAANTFTYPGHTFAGWSDGTTTYAAGASYTLSSDGAAIVFTAQWSTNATDDYSYAPGTGTGTAPASGSGLDGTTITLAANTFTYPGHTFAGWSDGTTTYAAGPPTPSRAPVSPSSSRPSGAECHRRLLLCAGHRHRHRSGFGQRPRWDHHHLGRQHLHLPGPHLRRLERRDDHLCGGSLLHPFERQRGHYLHRPVDREWH